MLRIAAIVFAVSVALLTSGEAEADDPAGLEPSAICAPSLPIGTETPSAGCGPTGSVAKAYPPVMVAPMYARNDRFTIALVDERSPDGTKYKITVTDPGTEAAPHVLDWSTSHCRELGGLRHHAWHRFEVIARSPSGHETEPVEYWMWRWGPDAPELTPTDDPWLSDRVAEVVSIYNLTDAAHDMLTDLPFRIHPNEPGFAGYGGPNRGVGLGLATQPWTFMHESMHAFWEHWDGFPLPCDQMNVWTFRRDLTRFLLQFLLYERPGRPNPLEDDRRYFSWLAADFRLYRELSGESAWDLVFRTYRSDAHFGEAIWHLFYHIADTDPPMLPLGNVHLLPPSLSRYFDRFIEREHVYATDSWVDHLTYFESLAEADKRLMLYVNPNILRLYAGGYDPEPPEQFDARLPEPLRTQARNADRQTLVDFVNTLEFMGCNADCEAWWEVDPYFWTHYSLGNLIRLQLYGDELDGDVGIGLEESNWKDVQQALDTISTCEIDTAEKRGVIDSLPNVTDSQRATLLAVLSVRDGGDWICDLSILARGETGGFPSPALYRSQGRSRKAGTERCHGLRTTPPSDLSKPPCS